MFANVQLKPPILIGLDIGGTKTAVVLGDRSGAIAERIVFATRPERDFDATYDELCESIDTMFTRANERGASVAALSVSIGGPLDTQAGIIKSPPNLPGWDQIPLRQLLEERFERPVCIEHDGNAGALAEWRFGAAKGAQHVVFLTMGTGFGGGLILNGQLHRGACDLAGEVGHVRIAETGPEAFGKAGSWEGLCGGAGIAKRALDQFPGRWKPGGNTVHELADLARAGDRDALDVLNHVGRDLGRGLAMLIDILNPEVIVIGSLAYRLGDLVLKPAREVVAAEALPAAGEACRIVPAALGERLGDVAALCAGIIALGGPLQPTN